MSNYVEVSTIKQLSSIIKSNAHVVVKFYSPTCPHCIAIAGLYRQLAKSNQNIAFVCVDVNKVREAISKYALLGWPVFFAFKNGRQAGKFTGGSVEAIQSAIRKAM